MSPCKKTRISNSCLEFQKLQKFKISSKRYSSFSSCSIILKFLLEKLGIECQSFTFLLRIPEIAETPDFFKTLLLLEFLFDHSEIFIGETRHIVSPYNKAGISNFCLEFQKLQKFQISSKRYSSLSFHSIIRKCLLEKLGIYCHPITKPGSHISA